MSTGGGGGGGATSLWSRPHSSQAPACARDANRLLARGRQLVPLFGGSADASARSPGDPDRQPRRGRVCSRAAASPSPVGAFTPARWAPPGGPRLAPLVGF